MVVFHKKWFEQQAHQPRELDIHKSNYKDVQNIGKYHSSMTQSFMVNEYVGPEMKNLMLTSKPYTKFLKLVEDRKVGGF